MTSIFKLMPQIVAFVLMAGVANVSASASQSGETERILQAMALYAKATPMDQLDTRRTELLQQSESILLDVIAKNPGSLDAHRKLTGVYLQMRDYSSAIRVMQDAISLSPGDPKLFIALAILYEHQGAYEYALPVLDQALALDPGQQLAQDYKIALQHKIDMQNAALQSDNLPSLLGPSQSGPSQARPSQIGPHDMDSPHSR